MFLSCYVAGEDYTGGIMIINIAANVSTQLFNIPIINSNTVECNETFNVIIKSVTGCGVAIGNNHSSEVIIKDNLSKYTCIFTSYVLLCSLSIFRSKGVIKSITVFSSGK